MPVFEFDIFKEYAVISDHYREIKEYFSVLIDWVSLVFYSRAVGIH